MRHGLGSLAWEWSLPIAFAAALLLGVGRGLAGVAGLAEVLGEMLFRRGGAVGKAGVVAVSSFVAAGHWDHLLAMHWLGLGGG